MKKLTTLLALAISISSNAQTWVTIPDANFATYLQGLIPAAMSGNQMDITNTLVTTTTHTINVAGDGIANLSGIQYFTTLQSLVCSGNYLTTLPALPNSLIQLDCIQNTLTSLPALPNALIQLSCDNNSLTSLPALPNSLIDLECYQNSLTTLPALPNSLTYLYCYNNSITSLPTLPNSLQVLSCGTNSLTTLPALPNSITELRCYNNNITCFLTFSTSISIMMIDNNPFNCLPNYIAAMSAADLATPLCAAGNSNGCAVTAAIQTHNQAGVSIFSYGNAIITNGTIAQGQQLRVYNTLGQVVLTTALQNNIETNLASGIYTIQVIDNMGSIIEIKKCALISN
ncbi:MAG TPA: leucine-rich repeat domain-containing protein [Bacteroidia bacterium]